MLNTTGRMCDVLDGLFLDSHSRRRRESRGPRFPPATGPVRLNERNNPILTMMLVGRPFDQFYEFGVQRRAFNFSPEIIARAVFGAQETEDTCEEGEGFAPLAAPATPPVLEDDKGVLRLQTTM